MALRARILAGVETAFTGLQDLVVDVQLNRRVNSGYDFNTQSLTADLTSTGITGIFLTEGKRSREGNRVTGNLIIRSADVPDIETYDSFVVNGQTHDIVEYTDNGFIVEITSSGADN